MFNRNYTRADIEATQARVKWVADLCANGGGGVPGTAASYVIAIYSSESYIAKMRAGIVSRYLRDEQFREFMDGIRECAIAEWHDKASLVMQYENCEGDSGWYGDLYDDGNDIDDVMKLLRENASQIL